MKRILTMILVITMMVFLLGGAATAEAKPEKLTCLIWGSVDSQQTYDKLIEEHFEKVYGIEVETILVPEVDFYEKLTIMLATDTAPDVCWVYDDSFEVYLQAGMLADLTALANDETFDYNDIVEAQRISYSKDGVPYAMPFSAPPQVLFYNKTLLDAAGLESPNELYAKGEWTSDKFYEYVLKLNNPESGVYGVNFTRAADWASWTTSIIPLMRSFGVEKFWSDDGKEWLMNSEEAVAALSMFGDLMFKYNAHPKPGDSADFFAGQCAFYPSFFSDTRRMVDLSFEWDCAPMPTAANGTYSGWMGTAGIGVVEGSKNKEWAFELLKVLAGKEFMAALANTYVPPRTSILSSDEYITGNNGEVPRPSLEHYQQSVLDYANVIRGKQLHVNIQYINDIVTTNLEAFYMQMVDARECLQAIADEVAIYMLP